MIRIPSLISGVLLSLAVFAVQAVELEISAKDAYAKTQQTEKPVAAQRVPRVQMAVCVQRRVPQEPFHKRPLRQPRKELPVRRLPHVLRACGSLYGLHEK